jgi:copper chaperone
MERDNGIGSRSRQMLSLSIEGMHCGACVRRVTNALSSIPGVDIENVQVGLAKVAYSPEMTSPQEITAAVNGIGFTAAEQRS